MIKAYFKGVYRAKMSSTQRSESANSMLKKYVPASSPMHIICEALHEVAI